jgi:hypothetical protein
MYVKFCACGREGQFLPSFAIQVRNVGIQGASPTTISLSVKHMDDESEQVTITVNYDLSINEDRLARLMSFHIVDYPDCDIISKDEFREIVGPSHIIDYKNNRLIPRG